jgi:2-polyprenyl-3-methyl-5-hydroxy-6-metoxy-1,4-benzoquinol methylase
MIDFAVRSHHQEIMDDLECSGYSLERALHELDVINHLLGGNQVTFSGLKSLLGNSHGTYSLADLGCGGGGMLQKISDWGKKNHFHFELSGFDANPNVIEYAKAHHDQDIRFSRMNILTPEFRQFEFDVFVCTLFLHHFTETELVSIFRQLYQSSKIGFVVNDLHRHWFAYHSIKWITRLFSRSPMVINDAPVSVLRGFSKQELKNILEAAGIKNYQLTWKWAFRWQLVVKK